MPRSDFLDSPQGLLARYRTLSRQRLYLTVDSIEPRSKKAMRAEEKTEFQRQVLQGLRDRNRRGFRRKIALQLSLSTAGRAASPGHHLAKNLLDLLGEPRDELGARRRGVLYQDDQCVETLSVAARHGEENISTRIVAMNHGAFLEQLSLAAEMESQMESRREKTIVDEAGSADELRLMVDESDRERGIFGSDLYEVYLDLARREAQQTVLGAGTSLRLLAWLHGLPPPYLWLGGSRWAGSRTSAAERMLLEWPVRIVLDELPQEEGGSDRFKAQVREKVSQFHRENAWLLQPLTVPVAMQVVIKPAPTLRRRGLHDLDNVVRKYLVGPVVEMMKPPADLVLTFGSRGHQHSSGSQNGWGKDASNILSNLRVGLTRYEVWRLAPTPEAEGRGFVTVALVPDPAGTGGPFSQMDSCVRDFADLLADRD